MLSSLLNAAGFKILEEELKAYIEAVEIEQTNMRLSPCNHIGTINFINGKRAGLKELENILAGFREELLELAGER